jgi:hypothetical protein
LGDIAFLLNYANQNADFDEDVLFDESLKPPNLFVGNDSINMVDVAGLLTVAGADTSASKIHGSWDSGPEPSVSKVTKTGYSGFKLNPGGNIGVGLGGIDYLITGTIKGKIRCEKTCPVKNASFIAVLDEWHLDITANLSFPASVGFGITQKYVNYGYNIPKKVIGTGKAIKEYSRYQKLLKAVAENQFIPDELCKLHKKDAALTLSATIQKGD